MKRQPGAFPVNGQKLKALRRQRHWTMADLEEASGLPRRTINRCESGKNVRRDTVEVLANTYGVDSRTLWADYEPPTIEPGGKDPTAVYFAILKENRSLAKELDVTQSALVNFFKILEQQHVPPGDLDAKLRDIAMSYKQFHQRLQTIEPDSAEAARLYTDALIAAERGAYDYARTLLDEVDRIDAEATEALEGRLNKKRLSRAATSAAKGDSYQMQLRYDEAVVCYRQALAFVEQIPEGHEQELAIYLDLLGAHLHTQGDFANSRAYYERALAIREQVLGPKHPDTANILNSLGILCRRQGDFANAKAYYERALTIREKGLGPEHRDTANTLNNLGALFRGQDDFANAKAYYERALAIREKTLGPEHPDTAKILNNLGILFRDQGNLAEAKAYYERALAIREKVLGPEHPDTIKTLNRLASLSREKDDDHPI